MIARSPHPQEHCGHECVCDDFHPEYDPDYQEVCNNKDCPHDTRSHSSAGPVPEPEKTNGGDPWNCTDLGIECPDPEQDWCNWPCDKWLEYHDAGVARAERERALDAIWQWLKEHDCWKSDHGNYWAPVPFPASDLMQYLESLRGEQR